MPKLTKPPPVPPRSSQAKPTVSYRFPVPLIEALERYAKRQGTGPNAAIEHLLTWALEQAGEPPRHAA